MAALHLKTTGYLHDDDTLILMSALWTRKRLRLKTRGFLGYVVHFLPCGQVRILHSRLCVRHARALWQRDHFLSTGYLLSMSSGVLRLLSPVDAQTLSEPCPFWMRVRIRQVTRA